jgi:hypothetical protein
MVEQIETAYQFVAFTQCVAPHHLFTLALKKGKSSSPVSGFSIQSHALKLLHLVHREVVLPPHSLRQLLAPTNNCCAFTAH